MNTRFRYTLPVLALATLPLWPSHAFAAALYEGDFGSGKIYSFDTDTGARTTFASGLSQCMGLAFDQSGNLFELDYGSTNIYKFTPSGSRTTFATGLGYAEGMAFDSGGNLFLAEGSSGNLYKYAPNGSRTTFATGLNNPKGLAFSLNGTLYAADSNTGNIYQYTAGGTRSTFVNIGNPTCLAFDSKGNLFETDEAAGLVQEFVNTGGGVLSTTPLTIASGIFYVDGLAFDGNGDLFVTDGNPSGHIYEFANIGGVLSGKTTFATGLNIPFDLAIRVVPEPSSWMLAGMGAGCAMLLRRRRA